MLPWPGSKGIDVADPGGGLKEWASKLVKLAPPAPASPQQTPVSSVTLTRVNNPKCVPF